MPAAGELLVAGPYTVTYGAVSMGLLMGDEQSPAITRTQTDKPIDSTNLYGSQELDSIETGDLYQFEATCLEYSRAKSTYLDRLATWGRQPVIGRLKWSMAVALVLTAVAGTSASTVPATITASRAAPARGFAVKIFYGPLLRVVPVRMILFPFDVGGGVIGNFTET